MLPTDPMILLSFLNTRLRDEYDSLDVLCEDLALDQAELSDRMKSVGFDYDPERNQFR